MTTSIDMIDSTKMTIATFIEYMLERHISHARLPMITKHGITVLHLALVFDDQLSMELATHLDKVTQESIHKANERYTAKKEDQ